ncbi:MAG: ATP-binding cassette domain-containing protein, partial [Desulfovibrio sp.]|nr:ATP-binding cassette domain-containing protein [Desulfovibrio sp.]
MRDVSFDVMPGDIFFITGGSGCGKSTLLKVLMGLKRPQDGTVAYDGVDFWGNTQEARSRIMQRAGVL